MKTSEYYDLNLVEGTDLVNPLIQDVPNYEKIDEQMFLNSVASVGQAVELKNGTVHALTRENPDASMFRFVATSKFDRGDTFVVDGVQVTGLRTDGKALDDGAYVINSNVLCCLSGTVLTLFVASGDVVTAENALKLGGEEPSYYGKASDVETAITTANAAGLLSNSAMELARETSTNLSDLQTKVVNKLELLGRSSTRGELISVNRNLYSELLFMIHGTTTPSQFNTTTIIPTDIINTDDRISVSVSNAANNYGGRRIDINVVDNGFNIRNMLDFTSGSEQGANDVELVIYGRRK